MVKCQTCKKNANKTRVLTNGVCNECSLKDAINYDDAPCNPEDTLGTIKFKDFVEWMLEVFAKRVNESVTSELAECKKQLADTKKDLADARKELATAKSDIQSQETKLKTLNDDHEKSKKCSKDNLRYLINHDRNVRQRNVLLFGLPDEDEVTLGEETFESDRDAVQHIFEKLGVSGEIKMTDFFRLGKKEVRENDEENDEEEDERPRCRPVKICFESSNMTKCVLSNSSKLKDKFGEDVKIYIKPDKTKAERDEFSRLGKKKNELLLRHPVAAENGDPRVVLKNGRLLVDNAQVDCYNTPQTLF